MAGDGDLKAGYAQLLSGKFGGDRMTANFDALVMALNSYAHAGRHEQQPHERVTRADAVFVWHATLAVLQRVTRAS